MYSTKVYNKVLTPGEIENLYNADLPTYQSSSDVMINQGLTLYLDATNPNSYTSGSSTWYDLSGYGNNGTLYNGVGYSSTYGGGLSFDGVDDYVSLPGIITLTDFTATAVYKVSSLNTGWAMFFGSTDTDNFIAIGNDRTILRVQDKNSVNSDLRYTSTLNQITILQVVQSGNTNTWYINGTNIGTSTNPTYAGMEIDRMVYYADGNSLGIWAGNYYYANLYNRALSAQEVLQNYNATKTRFGL
jgi:hypothetical protein